MCKSIFEPDSVGTSFLVQDVARVVSAFWEGVFVRHGAERR